jgi:hypothetical protein
MRTLFNPKKKRKLARQGRARKFQATYASHSKSESMKELLGRGFHNEKKIKNKNKDNEIYQAG